MKNENGITLVSLVVTIVVLFMLTSLTMNLNIDSYQITKINAYVAQMKTIQTKVDNLVENSNLDKSNWTKLESISNSNSDVFNFFQGIISNPTLYNIDINNSWKQEFDGNISNYYYFTPEDLDSKLGLKNQELTVIINFKTRNIISLQYIKKDGKKYYRQYDLLGGDSLKNSYTLAEMISVENYGDYIDLGTHLLDKENITLADSTSPATDWRIFYKDENGVYAILADYILPWYSDSYLNDFITNIVGLNLPGSSYPYSINSSISRKDLITKLANTKIWNNLLLDSNYGNSSNSSLSKNSCKTFGTIDLETWINSWNENNGYAHLITNFRTGMSDGLKGYYIGIGNDGDEVNTASINLSSDAGYNNSLYYPRKNAVSGCFGYWLTSPSANGNTYVMYIDYSRLDRK